MAINTVNSCTLKRRAAQTVPSRNTDARVDMTGENKLVQGGFASSEFTSWGSIRSGSTGGAGRNCQISS